jgi:hypothetical protein
MYGVRNVLEHLRNVSTCLLELSTVLGVVMMIVTVN